MRHFQILVRSFVQVIFNTVKKSRAAFIAKAGKFVSMAANSRLRTLIGSSDRVGLGGEGILRTEGKVTLALAMLKAAYESGIRYYDSAPAYAGSEEYYGRYWAQNPSGRDATFQSSKSAQRDAAGAFEDLTNTLSHMGRDHLGLWQIHDVRSKNDIRQIEDPDGALHAFTSARETGMVKGIGVTGHYDPAILLHAVSEWDIDSVLLPINPIEGAIGGFDDKVIAAARERDIGVIGMKVLGAGNFIFPDAGLTPERLIRYALSQDVDIVIVGCSTPAEAQILARLGREHTPMDDAEQAEMVEAVQPYAERLAFYRGVI
jgi:predicted aldo/keto reductase-like oxidoreductase